MLQTIEAHLLCPYFETQQSPHLPCLAARTSAEVPAPDLSLGAVAFEVAFEVAFVEEPGVDHLGRLRLDPFSGPWAA